MASSAPQAAASGFIFKAHAVLGLALWQLAPGELLLSGGAASQHRALPSPAAACGLWALWGLCLIEP